MNQSADRIHFRKGNGAALCRGFVVGNRIATNPDPMMVTCPKCRQLLDDRNKVKPMRMREDKV